jgi:hypothetical protein
MSGRLIKRPPAGSVVSYSQARWFVLGHDGTLTYLTKEGGAKKGDVERFEDGLYFIEEPRDDPESTRRPRVDAADDVQCEVRRWSLCVPLAQPSAASSDWLISASTPPPHDSFIRHPDKLVFILSPLPPAQQKQIELQRMHQQGRAAARPSKSATLSRKYVLEAENDDELIYWKQALANFCTAPEFIAPRGNSPPQLGRPMAHTVAGVRPQGRPQYAARSQMVRPHHSGTAHAATPSARTVPKMWKKTTSTADVAEA